MKNIDQDKLITSSGQSNDTLFKEQSSQTILSSLDIEKIGLFVEVGETKKEKRKRNRRKKISSSDSKDSNLFKDMKENDNSINEISDKDEKNKRHPKANKMNSHKNNVEIKKTYDAKSKADKPSKERLFDPISKKYVKPKNKVNDKSKDNQNDKKLKNMPISNNKNHSHQNSNNKKNNKINDKNSFPPYYIREMVEKGLKDGLLIEGTLRINPKNYEDAFVTNDMKNEPDIYIGGMMNRNRAFNGDDVIVDILPESEWKVNHELVGDYLLENDLDELPTGSIATTSENTNDMIVKFKRLGVKFDLKKGNETLDNSESGDDIESASNVSNDVELKHKTSEIESIETNSTSNSNFNGVCVPLEDLEEADFDCNQNSTIGSNVILSDSESIASSDGVDIVIDDITELNEAKSSKVDIRLNDSVNSSNLNVKNDISTETTQEKMHKTRRKRGSKKKKDIIDSKTVNTKHEVIEFLKQNDSAVLLRGIPFKSTAQDIVKFFGDDFSLVENDVFIPTTKDGQNNGQAYVKLSNANDVEKALKKNKECIETRYVEIFDGKSILKKLLPPRLKAKSRTEHKKDHEYTISQIKVAFPNNWQTYAQKTGRVVAIREAKHSRSAVGHLVDRPGDENFALFKPTDNRVPRMLIAKANCPPGFWKRQQDFESVLFVAKVIKWDKVKFALGDITHAIGDDSSVENRTTGILIENEIKTDEFTKAVINDLPPLPFVIPSEEISKRRDLRNECIFTIDPLTARDLDDALSIEKLEDGNFKVGVHIADVSYFVKDKTELDMEAQERATSVYLVQKVVPMLPRHLCENLCSLNPNEDRLTFSVEWKMTEQGEILEEWFGRSVINSAVKLAYEHAQDMLDQPKKEWSIDELPPIKSPWTSKIISEKVGMLQNIAVNLRSKRENSGALRLDQPKLCFTLNKENGLPLGFKMYEHRHSNKLIEEFMLLANISVAKKLYQTFPNLAVLRNHMPPKDNMMCQVIKEMEKYNIYLDASSSKTLNESLNAYKPIIKKEKTVEDHRRNFRYQVLMNILSRPMVPARYFCSGFYLKKAEDDREDEEIDYHHHYALSVPLYTHFTSPIRRYPDILVHRLLDAAIEGTSLDWSETVIQRLASHCNDKKKAAKTVSEASDEMFLASFIKECGPCVVEGMVIKVFDKAVDCLLFDMAVIKRVYLENLVVSGKLKSFELIKRRQQAPQLKLSWIKNNNGDSISDTSILDVFSIVSLTLISDKDKSLCFKADLNSP